MRLFWMQYSQRIRVIGSIILGMFVLGLGVWYFTGSPVDADTDGVSMDDQHPAVAAIPSWDAMTLSQRESEIAAALQCGRSADVLPLEIDSALDAEAHTIIAALATVTDTDHLFAPYDWAMVAPIWFDAPGASGCGWTDFDPATLELNAIQRIGIALAPPVGYAPASVVILGQEAP